jgi:hypothetical protein
VAAAGAEKEVGGTGRPREVGTVAAAATMAEDMAVAIDH